MTPIRFGDHSRELAVHVSIPRYLLHERGPSRAIPGLDLGLRQMVDDKWLFGKPGDQVERSRQVSRIDENVVRKPKLAEAGKAADKVLADQKAVVWLILSDVA